MFRDKRYVYGDDNVYVPVHMHFGHEMMKKMMEYKDMMALINSDTNEKLTYLELAQETANIAVSLTRMGVRKGDVISVCSEKRFEVMSTILGANCAGAVFSPVDITYGTVPLLHRVKIAKPKIMFCSSSAFKLHKEAFDTVGCVEKYIIYNDYSNRNEKQDNELTKDFNMKSEMQYGGDVTKKIEYQDGGALKKIENQDGGELKKIESQHGGIFFNEFIKEDVNLDDFMPVPVEGLKDYLFILFSSGTTGLPKGVPWTHLGFLMNSLCYYDESFKNSCLLNTREWYYTYGLLYTLGCLRGGSTIVYTSGNEEIDWFKAIEKYKIKILQLAPASVNELIKSSLINQFDVSSVEMIISSSTPITADKVDAVKKRLPSLKNVYQIYGTSEAGCAGIELNAKCGARSGSVGVPAPGFIFKVVDLDTDEILRANKRGEIRFKSPCLTPGRKQATTFVWRTSPGPFTLKKFTEFTSRIGYLQMEDRSYMDADGFYKTGDVGYYDSDGYFYIVNRIKELIKYNDISIAPAELEAILEQHPAVREAGVAGLPSEASGERPVAAVVVAGDQVTRRELVEFVNRRITYRMRLTGACFVEVLPRGAGAKLDRQALKDILLNMDIEQETSVTTSVEQE